MIDWSDFSGDGGKLEFVGSVKGFTMIVGSGEIELVRNGRHPGKTEKIAEGATVEEVKQRATQMVIEVLEEWMAAVKEEAGIQPDGVALIAAERKRAIQAEGWTPEHDDQHESGELVSAAAAYALHGAGFLAPINYNKVGIPLLWPWELRWWKPKDPITDLIRAGQLIAAEIDRRLRQTARPLAIQADFAAQAVAAEGTMDVVAYLRAKKERDDRMAEEVADEQA